jgi:small subunit ribosomal protein S6
MTMEGILSRYEGMYIFPESFKDERLEEAINRAKQEIEKLGGKVEHVTRLGRKVFARPMKKQEAGQYVVMTFDLEGAQLRPLKERYRLSEEVFRIQVIRQDQEPAADAPTSPPGPETKEEPTDAVS